LLLLYKNKTFTSLMDLNKDEFKIRVNYEKRDNF